MKKDKWLDEGKRVRRYTRYVKESLAYELEGCLWLGFACKKGVFVFARKEGIVVTKLD